MMTWSFEALDMTATATEKVRVNRNVAINIQCKAVVYDNVAVGTSTRSPPIMATTRRVKLSTTGEMCVER
jgi:hypothetical protein